MTENDVTMEQKKNPAKNSYHNYQKKKEVL